MIYYITLIALYVLGFYNVYSDNKKYITRLLVLALCWLVLHDGLRWETATDWTNYYRFFVGCLQLNLDNIYFEKGYVFSNVLVRYLTDDYTVYLLLHAACVYTLIGITLKKYAAYPLLSLALFYALMLGYLGMNRQYVTLAIAFFSIRFIIERQLYPFIACMIIGMLFHNSAIIFTMAYFLTKPFKRIIYTVVLAVFFLISMSGIIRMLPLELFYIAGSDMGDKMDTYNYLGNESISMASQLMGIMKRMIWIVIVLIYYDAFKKVENFALFFNLYFIALCLYLLFNNTPLQVIVARGILSLNLFEIMIMPMILFVFKDNETRKICFAGFVVYGFMIMLKAINTYVEVNGEDIFNPYRCVLFE